MPVVLVDAQNLHERLRNFHPRIDKSSEFHLDTFEHIVEELGFAFGVEVDGVDFELGPAKPRLRIEVPANRYDLLCESGISSAFQQFIAPLARPLRKYRHSKSAETTLRICASTYPIRPYAAAAIFRNVSFTTDTFAAFIDLQDKLHQNLARKRALVAMGTHNLDAVEPPFSYECAPRKGGFKFIPLNQTREVDGDGMLEVLADSHVKPYFPLIDKFDNFPVIFDSKRRVCSVPPIINSELSKMDKDTRNVFVELTGVDEAKIQIILDQLTAFLGELMNDQWTVEPVQCIYEDSHPGLIDRKTKEVTRQICTPTLKLETFTLDLNYCKRITGIEDITPESIVKLLIKMGLDSAVDEAQPNNIIVTCPINRRDVLGPCDVVEEVAIAYGFNNIKYSASPSVEFISIQNIYERARRCLVAAGWKECLTFGLISQADAYQNLGRQCKSSTTQEMYSLQNEPIYVNAPKTREFEIVRPTLIPGLLQTLSSNQANNLPIKIFETGEVVAVDTKKDNRSNQSSRIAALIAHAHGACLEHIHGLVDHFLSEFGFEAEYALTPTRHSHHKYFLQEYMDGLFLPKRAVKIMVYEDGAKDSAMCIGIMGVVHPNTLKAFGIPWVCSLFEISMEPLLKWLDELSQAAP